MPRGPIDSTNPFSNTYLPDSVAPTGSMVTNLLTISDHHPEQIVPSSSNNHVNAPTSPASSSATQHSFSQSPELLITLLISVLVALFSISYQNGGKVLIPTAFIYHPPLFDVFIILYALAFTASVASILLQLKHRRISEFLLRLVFTVMIIIFYLFTWVILPGHLKPVMYLLVSIIIFVMLLKLYEQHRQGNSRQMSTIDSNLGASDNDIRGYACMEFNWGILEAWF